MKKLFFPIFLAIVLSIACNLLYNQYLSPNNNFFARGAEKSDSWSKKLRFGNPAPCYVFAGGSEIRMGIDPKIMLNEYGIHAINAAGQGGYGLACNTVLGLSYLQTGDYLVLSLNEPFLNDMQGITPDGIKFCWRRLGTKMFDNCIIPFSLKHVVNICKGNAGEWSMFLAKLIIAPNNMYKYNKNVKIHESGWCENFYNEPLSRITIPRGCHLNINLNDNMVSFLAKLHRECSNKGVQLIIFNCMDHTTFNLIPKKALIALRFTEMGIPVLKIPNFNCQPNPDYFADPPSHLNTYGCIVQSRATAKSLKENAFWTSEELLLILSQHGYDSNGQYLGETSY